MGCLVEVDGVYTGLSPCGLDSVVVFCYSHLSFYSPQQSRREYILQLVARITGFGIYGMGISGKMGAFIGTVLFGGLALCAGDRCTALQDIRM